MRVTAKRKWLKRERQIERETRIKGEAWGLTVGHVHILWFYFNLHLIGARICECSLLLLLLLYIYVFVVSVVVVFLSIFMAFAGLRA